MNSAPQWRVGQWFPRLSEELLRDLKVYHGELLRFNESINLISPKTAFEADLLHFADSIQVSGLIKEELQKLIVHDIGSGNGFPGLVLGILNRETEFVLVDSDLKKQEFTKFVAAKLGLKNVRTLCRRLEDMKKDEIQVGISRAFAPLSRSLDLGVQVFKVGGIYLNMKTHEWTQEVATLTPQICSTWNTRLLHEYELPMNGTKRSILKSIKTK